MRVCTPDKYYCDKCGNIIKSWELTKPVAVRGLYSIKEFDLCPKCRRKLIKWIKEEDDEDDI